MVDFIAYLIITLNVFAFNRHTHCFNNISVLHALQQLVMASSVRHLLCIHFIYFFRKKKGTLSNKMRRNVAASNDQLTNMIKCLRKKSKCKAVFTYRHNSPGPGLVFCLKAILKKWPSIRLALLLWSSLPVVWVQVQYRLVCWAGFLLWLEGLGGFNGEIALAVGTRSGWDCQVMHYNGDILCQDTACFGK